MTYHPNVKTKKIESDRVQLSPLHPLCANWVFTHRNHVDAADEAVLAENEANLADAISRVAANNGLSVNDVMHVFPFILRMLKSESNWSK